MNQWLINFIFTRFTFPIVSVIFVVGFYLNIQDMKPLAINYPLGVIGILVIIIFWTLIEELLNMFKNREKEEKEQINILSTLKDWRRPIMMIALFGIYINVISYIGFYVSTILFLIILFTLLDQFRKKHLLSASAIVFVNYIVFTVWLKVPLPSGMFI